jgi:hypothetical protein
MYGFDAAYRSSGTAISSIRFRDSATIDRSVLYTVDSVDAYRLLAASGNKESLVSFYGLCLASKLRHLDSCLLWVSQLEHAIHQRQ